MEDIAHPIHNHISPQQRLSGAMEHLGNVLINRSFQSQDELFKPAPPTPNQKGGYLLPEFSTDSIGEMLGGPLYQGMNMTNKFDTVSGTRSRLQSLLEKYTESDPRSDKDEDGFVVPPPMSPYHSLAKNLGTDHRLSQVLSQCRAWNYDDFRHRLQTFSTPVNWFGKPDFLSPIECALHGWCNVDVNTIHCFHCKESVKHTSDSLQMDLELPRGLLTDSHAPHCGWRKSCCRRFFANVPNFDFPDKAFIDTSLDFLDLLAATAKMDFQTIDPRLVEGPALHATQEPLREGGEIVAGVLLEEVLRSAESELQGERKEVEAVVRGIVDNVGATSEPSDPITTSEEASAAITSPHLDNNFTAVATAVAGEVAAVDLTPFTSSNDCDLPFLRHLLPSSASQSSHLSLQEQPLSFLLSRLAAVSSLPPREVVTVHLIDLLVKFFEAFPATDAIDLPRLLFLAVVCGWKHSSGRSEATSPSAIPATSSIASSSDANRLVLHCSLCCQRFDVLDLCVQGKKLNLLTQHRYYCPFVGRQFFYDDVTDTGKDKRDDEKVVVGWECRLQAINHFFEGKISTSFTPASAKRKRVFADISQGGGVVLSQEKKVEEQLPPPASVHLSPENVYKKIRSVLYDALN
eukprot:gene11101-12097_t